MDMRVWLADQVAAERKRALPVLSFPCISLILENGRTDYETIGNAQAEGICGLGLIDAVSVMLQSGALEATGCLLDAAGISPQALDSLLLTGGLGTKLHPGNAARIGLIDHHLEHKARGESAASASVTSLSTQPPAKRSTAQENRAHAPLSGSLS